MKHYRNAYFTAKTLFLGCLATWLSACNGNFVDASSENTLVVLDVGQGLSCLVQSEGDFWLLDAGGDSAVPWDSLLRAQGVQKLRGIVISHWHLDHYSGLGSILEKFPVDSLWYGPDTGYAYVRDSLFHSARQRQVGMRQLSAPQNLQWNTLQTQVVWPQSHISTAEGNPSSLVLRIGSRHAGWFMFTGDIGFDEEQQMLIYNSDLVSDVLIIPHHGSAGSSSVAWLGAINPYFAAISSGDNPWGHPRLEVLERLRLVMGKAAENRILRTDQQGNLHFRQLKDFGWTQDF